MSAIPAPKGYTANKVKLVKSGKDYFDTLLSIINRAQHVIHVQVYIYNADKTGNLIADALKAAAARKVKVYVLADGYGSNSLPASFSNNLKEAGINFRFFGPFFRNKHFYLGRRLHQKVVVADSQYALVGGINISDRYNDMPGQPAWFDFALYIEGPVAEELCRLCHKTWQGFATGLRIPPCMQYSEPGVQKPLSDAFVRMRRNDWVNNKRQITATYFEMLSKATSRITLLCSYFVPGNKFRRRLKKAVKKGVKITVILQRSSDSKLAKNAERYWYDWLLRNNIEIYEYKENVLHGKVAVCDSEWLTIGSYNVNNISAYASIELNLDVRDQHFATSVEHSFEEVIKNNCTRITKDDFAYATNNLKYLAMWLSYQIYRLLFYLFTFYFKQERN